MRKSTRIGICVIALLGSVLLETAFAATGDLMGAQEVIHRLGRVSAVPVGAKPDAGTAAAETLARDLREFKTVRDKMTAEEAAGLWFGAL